MARTLPMTWSLTALQDKGFVDGDGNVVDEAFEGVGGLPDVIILPVGVKTIGARAFSYCGSVTTPTPRRSEDHWCFRFQRMQQRHNPHHLRRSGDHW